MRLARDNSPVVTTVRTPFSLKSAQVFSPGKDITIISTGIMTYEALVAAEQLYATGIDAEVIHVPVIKPLDAVTILRSVQKTGAVITVEEAQLIGGLGSAVAELLGENLPTAMKRIGVVDRFGESGKPYELMDKFGLRSNDIVKAVHGLMTELGRQ
jgi:transketolase